MVFLFALGAVTLGVAAMLALRAAAVPHTRIASQLRQVKTYGFGEQEVVDEAKATRPMARFADRVGQQAIDHISAVKPLERRALMAAGMYDVSDRRFHGYRMIGAVGLPALILTLAILGSGSLTTMPVLMAVISGMVAWVFPAAHVRTRGQRRLDRVDRDLPELIDILTVTIEAGLGFGGSLQMVAGRFDGPLGDELRLTLQEQTMGLSTEVALSNMLDRCETPSMRSFVRAVVQGDSLGVSIGAMLRNVATEVRKRRRGLARERAMKAPVKLLFPLVFLIFPAMFLVLMYPAARMIIGSLGG